MSQDAKSGIERCFQFSIGTKQWAIPAAEVVEVRMVPRLTEVHGPPWVSGVVNIRGCFIPVVNLRQTLQADEIPLEETARESFSPTPADPGREARLVVFQIGDLPLGMIVDWVNHRLVQGVPSQSTVIFVGDEWPRFVAGPLLSEEALRILREICDSF